MAPFVREYTADAQVGGPFTTREARKADTGNTGNALVGLGDTLQNLGGAIQRRQAQNEITQVQADMAGTHAQLSIDLDSTFKNADPNDDSTADKFMEKYDSTMGGIGDKLSTPQAQQYFKKASAIARAHFEVATAQNQASVAGVNTVQNVNRMVDGYSATLQNDPSAFQAVKETNALAVQGYVENGLLSQNKANELQTRNETALAKAAIQGTITLDPNYAKQEINKGKWDAYLDGDLKHQLLGEADQGIRGMQAEASRQDAARRQALQDAQTATQNSFLVKLEKNELKAQDVLGSNLDPVGAGGKEGFLRMIKTGATEKIHTDPAVYLSLFNRIHAPDGDSSKLLDENTLNSYLGRGLDFNSLGQLRGEVQNRKTPEGTTESELKKNFLEHIVKGKLTKANPMVGIQDPEGDAHYQKYMSWFLPAYENEKKAGKNPVDLLNPTSPDYMGKNISAFQRTPMEEFSSIARGNGYLPPAPLPQSPPASPVAPGSNGAPSAAAPKTQPTREPRRPGETPAQYRARTGG